MVILLGFNNGRAGRMAAHVQRPTALSWYGELPGVRASAVAAVRFRGKASGCRVVRRVPAGASRPLSAVCASRPADCVRGPAPPGARRAPRALEAVK